MILQYYYYYHCYYYYYYFLFIKKVIANVAGQNLIQVTFFLHVDSQFSLSPFPKYL